jgi:hypothetical protein
MCALDALTLFYCLEGTFSWIYAAKCGMGFRKSAKTAQHNGDAGGAIGILVAGGLIIVALALTAGLVGLPIAVYIFGGTTASLADISGTQVGIAGTLSSVLVALASFRPSRAMQGPDQVSQALNTAGSGLASYTTTATTATTATPATTSTTPPILSSIPNGPNIQADAGWSVNGSPIVAYWDTSAPDGIGDVVGWTDPSTGVYTTGGLPDGAE